MKIKVEKQDNYIIKSVKRISDGTKFKIGDKILDTSTGYCGHIEEIIISNDIVFFMTDKYRLFENIIKIK